MTDIEKKSMVLLAEIRGFLVAMGVTEGSYTEEVIRRIDEIIYGELKE